MSVRDISAAEWPGFLEEFSRGHRAWLTTVDRVHPGSLAKVDAVERPLRSVTPDISARRVVGIEIRFQADSHARDVIRIEAPTRLRVDETAEGTAQGLEIQDEDGECTRIRFRATPTTDMLDGIAPGELPRT
ncbi:MAG: hypothetical protein GEU82_14770 [Luteitalea sp.]|nr:hypothetical protein [Luteitalea sp.]